jgi:uncharacterized membrane protein (UPF0127 family)
MRSRNGTRVLRNLRTGAVLARYVRVAETPGERELRLLSWDVVCSDAGLWLDRCTAVDTFGMRSTIDIVFLDASNRVIALHLRRAPNQPEICCARAHSSVQLGTSSERDVLRGDVLALD